ncbi:TIGR02450 family Trp-rich protein [Salinisphaera sp. Q1T1-3]|uniref:TIGR02450 family Trp-rich protein n=1 Tax=Salinisphaera sp. Q1T1-3 TaxID=2321229 RepID=UPI000E726EE4|nr:TIGR02450 family Trp-rich protein [Salinisphaera sp. Q1T1-3]RJS93255.1 TIGR02450 family Trp-rich protein [Salinisphaera sp. Q1T1-3]
MTDVHPNKLQNSKWTAVKPTHRERHFVVVDIVRDARQRVIDVVLEAVLTRRRYTRPWQDLKDGDTWQPGWH